MVLHIKTGLGKIQGLLLEKSGADGPSSERRRGEEGKCDVIFLA